MRRILVLLTCFLTLSSCAWGQGGEVKILYWNIQNGMWHDHLRNSTFHGIGMCWRPVTDIRIA